MAELGRTRVAEEVGGAMEDFMVNMPILTVTQGCSVVLLLGCTTGHNIRPRHVPDGLRSSSASPMRRVFVECGLVS